MLNQVNTRYWEATLSERRRVDVMLERIKLLFPDFELTKVQKALDAGCSNLVTTLEYARRFPHIDWLATDISPEFCYPSTATDLSCLNQAALERIQYRWHETDIDLFEQQSENYKVQVVNQDFYTIEGNYDLIISDNNLALVMAYKENDEVIPYLEIVAKMASLINVGGILAVNNSFTVNHSYFIRRVSETEYVVTTPAKLSVISLRRATLLQNMLNGVSEC